MVYQLQTEKFQTRENLARDVLLAILSRPIAPATEVRSIVETAFAIADEFLEAKGDRKQALQVTSLDGGYVESVVGNERREGT